MILPVWYKTYVALCLKGDMESMPFEFVYSYLKARPTLLSIIKDRVGFCHRPNETFRLLYNTIGDLFKRYKQLHFNDDDGSDYAVRTLGIGISAGVQDLKNYEKWLKANTKSIENKRRIKGLVEEQFTIEMQKVKQKMEEDTGDTSFKRDMGT